MIHNIVHLKSIRRFLASLTIAGLALAATACSTTAANTMQVSSSGTKSVRIINDDLDDDIKIRSGKLNYIGDKGEGVFVLENVDNESIRISVQFKWFDQDNIQIDSAARSWEPMVIHAGELKTIKDMAPQPNAKSVRIMIRLTDDQEY